MQDVCKGFLPEGWDEALSTSHNMTHLKASDNFWIWVNDYKYQNIALYSTDYFLNDDELCASLHFLLNAELCMKYKNQSIKEKVDEAVDETSSRTAETCLCTWTNELHKLADEHAHDNKHLCDHAEEILHAAKHQALSNNSRNANTFSSSSRPSSYGNNNKTHLPKLTNDEHEILHAHQGCLKCHCGYQNHMTCDCPNNFPASSGYKTITLGTMKSHHSLYGKPSSSMVESITTVSVEAGNMSDEHNTVSIIMPSSVLSSESEVEDDDVSIPHKSRHHQWHCQIAGTISDFPTPVNALLDSGVHVVLICYGTASCLISSYLINHASPILSNELSNTSVWML